MSAADVSASGGVSTSTWSPWKGPKVPLLPGLCPPLQLHDARDGKLHVAAPGKSATLYVCGITPYDATHLGHAATYLTFDLVVRAWIDEGKKVTYIQNISDLDDPLLERAEQTGADWQELGRQEVALFHADMTALRAVAPQKMPGFLEYVPAVAARVIELLEAGKAYLVPVSTGSDLGEPVDPDSFDVYADLSADPLFLSDPVFSSAYPVLDPQAQSPQQQVSFPADRADLLDVETRAAAFGACGGDPQRAGKRQALDPLLWRAARVGEPAWEFAGLPTGRPGWHIFCSTITTDLLDHIDVQGGGRDLFFPHHTMTEAQQRMLGAERDSENSRHVEHLVANVGLIGYAGEKMSKSRGNLVFVSKLREKYDPAVIRLALLAHHYRQDWQWSQEDLEAAVDRLALWKEAASYAEACDGADLAQAVREALANDLDTPKVLELIDAWAEDTCEGLGTDWQAGDVVADLIDARLGIDVRPTKDREPAA